MFSTGGLPLSMVTLRGPDLFMTAKEGAVGTNTPRVKTFVFIKRFMSIAILCYRLDLNQLFVFLWTEKCHK